MRHAGTLLIALLAGFGCKDAADTDAGQPQEPPEDPVLFPEAFEALYTEMRDCRLSHEHELRYIRVLVSDSAHEPYAGLSSDTPYPVGAILVKPEYDDDECSVVLGYTAMEKLEPGTSPENGDWEWQKLTAERELLDGGVPDRCIGCHSQHCAPPNGYDLTCAEEL
jgi:hypothetical protein